MLLREQKVSEVANNEYYTQLGRNLHSKSEAFRKTVALNLHNDEGQSGKRAFKMKLIYPHKIIPRGQNKSVMEVMQQKEVWGHHINMLINVSYLICS